MSHGKHSKTSQFFWSVEHNRGKTAGHFRVETDLDASLYLVLTLHEKIEQLLSVDHCFTEIRHQTNECSVPFIDDLFKIKILQH